MEELHMQKLLDGVVWGEGLRWHCNKLWFSDIFGKKIMTVDLSGKAELVAHVEGMPSGLGFLPNGNLIAVSGQTRTLLVKDSDGLKEYADLKPFSQGINDMVTDSKGNAYVGCYGFDMPNYRGGDAAGWIALVTPERAVSIVATGLMAPNGMVITPDEKTLIVADTFKKQLTAFDISSDGTLFNARIWAQLKYGPDGICLNDAGFVWAATPNSGEVICVKEGGQVIKSIQCTDTPLCCEYSAEQDTLFIVTVPAHRELSPEEIGDPQKARDAAGSVIYQVAL